MNPTKNHFLIVAIVSLTILTLKTVSGQQLEVNSIDTVALDSNLQLVDTSIQVFQSLNDYFNFNSGTPIKIIEKRNSFVGGWFFIVNIVLVSLMLIKFLLFSDYVKNSWNALINQNLFFQFIRGRKVINIFLFIVEFCFKVYAISLIAIFLIYLFREQWLLNFENFSLIYIGFFVFFSIKAIIAFLLSILTEHWKEYKAMSLINIVFVSNLSWLLIPLLCIVVYLNFQIRPYAIYVLLGLTTVAFILYVLRGISVLRKIRMNLNMHFFIYLCAFEIVPYLILTKVLYSFKFIF